MTLENLASLTYRPDRNRVYYSLPCQLRVFERYGGGAIKRALEIVLSGLRTKDGSDIHLEGCIATSNVLRMYIEDHIEVLNVIIYSKYDKVKYKLKRTGKFTTTLHQKRSPIVIRGIEGLHLKNNRERTIWLPGNNDIGNEIEGVLLFNQDHFNNPPKNFEEVINYDPST